MRNLLVTSSDCTFRILALAGLAMLAAACDQNNAQAADEKAPRAASVTEAAAPPEQVTAAPTKTAETPTVIAPKILYRPSYDETEFAITFAGPNKVKVGETLTYSIALSAKSGFKVNDEYPVKFQFAETAGVVPKKGTVRKDDAKVEKSKIELPLELVINQSGKHDIQGKLSFSVCTADRCLIEKRDLGIAVTAL